jgi:hypothetical protein
VNWEVIGYIVGFLAIIGFFAKLSERIAKMETKIEPIWQFVTQAAIEKLHSPNDEHGLDRLLEKFHAHTISLREAIELRDLLQGKLDEIPSSKKLSAAIIGIALEEMIKKTRERK